MPKSRLADHALHRLARHLNKKGHRELKYPFLKRNPSLVTKASGLVLALFFLRFFNCLFFFHGFSGFFLAFFFGVLAFGHDLSSRVEKIEFYLYRSI